MSLSGHWVIVCLLFILLAIAISIPVFFIVRRSIHFRVLQKHHELAGFVVSTLGVLYSVFLGFTIVNSQNNHNEIKDRVDKEAYLAANLLRITNAFPDPMRTQVEDGIKAYLKSVVVDEWPLMCQKRESPKTLEKLEEFWAPIYAYEPATERDQLWFGELLSTLMDFNSARVERIYSSWQNMGLLSWLIIIIGGIILVAFLFFFGTENMIAHLLMNSLFIGLLTFMIYVIYSLDHPFNPPHPINPRAYEVIYNYYSENPTENHNHLKAPEEMDMCD